MACAIYLRDALEPVLVDEDFAGAINVLNMSASKALTFVVMDLPDGLHEAFNIPNILRIKEIED